MFTIYARTAKMEAEGKYYCQAVARGTKQRMQQWFDVLCKNPLTTWCKIVRNKDRQIVAEYRR